MNKPCRSLDSSMCIKAFVSPAETGGMMQLSARTKTFLSRRLFATLSTHDDVLGIHSVVMWYMLLDDEKILMNTVKHRRQYQNILKNPRVSLCIPGEYNYVAINGIVTIIDETETAQQDILFLSTRYDGEKAARSFIEKTAQYQERVSLLLSTDHMREYWGVDNRQAMN
jgi:uncharacterized pyridoxamine 5'-phosphate oxidase family protein